MLLERVVENTEGVVTRVWVVEEEAKVVLCRFHFTHKRDMLSSATSTPHVPAVAAVAIIATSTPAVPNGLLG